MSELIFVRKSILLYSTFKKSPTYYITLNTCHPSKIFLELYFLANFAKFYMIFFFFFFFENVHEFIMTTIATDTIPSYIIT